MTENDIWVNICSKVENIISIMKINIYNENKKGMNTRNRNRELNSL
jgi:hypothetical protein